MKKIEVCNLECGYDRIKYTIILEVVSKFEWVISEDSIFVSFSIAILF